MEKEGMIMRSLQILSILFMISSAVAFSEADKPNVPYLMVKGHASLFKPAEEFSLVVSTKTRDVTAGEAIAINYRKMGAIIQFLQQVGLQAGQFHTQQFALTPIYSQRPKNPPPDWSPEIIAFDVTNRILIKTGKIEHAGKIIDGVTKAGADEIDRIEFGLRDSRVYRAEVIAAAAANAIADATTLASASGLKLKKILSVKLDEGNLSQPLYRKTILMSSEGFTTPIESGEIELNADVLVIYEVSAAET